MINIEEGHIDGSNNYHKSETYATQQKIHHKL